MRAKTSSDTVTQPLTMARFFVGRSHSIIIVETRQNFNFFACIMGCLIYSLEKLSERKRRVLFYIAFFLGGTLTLGGFAGFTTSYKGWAFIVVVSGIFILITTGILWDTMTHPNIPSSISCVEGQRELPTAPREEDDPPPDYDTVVRHKNLSRSNSKWSLYTQIWCPSFNPKMGYGKTATTECSDGVSDAPPSYNQSQLVPSSQTAESPTDRCLCFKSSAGPQVRRETKVEINQK